MQRRLIVRLLLVLLVLGIVAIVAQRLLRPAQVQAAHPTRGPAVQAIYATGNVEAGTTVRLAPRSTARLVELKADEGEMVKSGQLLARLEDRDLAATVTELQARADYAAQRLTRNQELRERGFISPDALQQSQAELRAARAALARAKEQLATMSIRAPANGRIIRRDGEIGDLITPTQPLFYLAADDSDLRIEADIDEEDIARIRLGQTALVSAGAFPGKVFQGKVAQITPRGDPVARSYRVRISLPRDTPLMIGMTTDVNVVIAERQNALLIPSTALAGNSVWLVRDGKLARQEVRIGAKGAERTEIIDGLTESDLVVVRPPEQAQSGQRVTTTPPAQ